MQIIVDLQIWSFTSETFHSHSNSVNSLVQIADCGSHYSGKIIVDMCKTKHLAEYSLPPAETLLALADIFVVLVLKFDFMFGFGMLLCTFDKNAFCIVPS